MVAIHRPFWNEGEPDHYNLGWSDVVLHRDIQCKEYLELVKERQTKTRSGADIQVFGHLTLKSLPPTMKNALRLKPADMLKDDFYIQVNNYYNKTGIWFKKQIVGINKISGIIPKMIKEAGITRDKRLTNTSAKKHLTYQSS